VRFSDPFVIDCYVESHPSLVSANGWWRASPLIDVFGRSSPMLLYSIAPSSSWFRTIVAYYRFRFILQLQNAVDSLSTITLPHIILCLSNLWLRLIPATADLICKSIVEGGIIVPHHSAALRFPQPRGMLFSPLLRHGCFDNLLIYPNCCLNFWPSPFDACIFGESSVDDRSPQLLILTALGLFVAEIPLRFWLPRAFVIIFHSQSLLSSLILVSSARCYCHRFFMLLFHQFQFDWLLRWEHILCVCRLAYVSLRCSVSTHHRQYHFIDAAARSPLIWHYCGSLIHSYLLWPLIHWHICCYLQFPW
jgi:hypothetical protein